MLVVHASRCLDHLVPAGFPEKPERVARIVEALSGDSRFEIREARSSPATALSAVAAVHSPRYVDRLRRAAERGDGLIDTADNPLSAATFDAATAASGAALEALASALAGRPAFAAIRPPGHHAEHDRAMGFCYFNYAAVLAEHGRRLSCERVAIVDIDVHHGNGTQHLFEERSDVLYASLHQFPFYPGTGALDETGRGAGRGFTVNFPLAAGGGDAEWLYGLDAVILPELERFAPELLVVSAGFDAWRDDPLGGMRVSEAGFAAIGARLLGFADARCAGRFVALLEGGYDVDALPRLATAFLLGVATPVT